MPNNQAPGPDGFTAEFYIELLPTLSALFHKLTAEIKEKSKLPSNINTANLRLFLKLSNLATVHYHSLMQILILSAKHWPLGLRKLLQIYCTLIRQGLSKVDNLPTIHKGFSI